MKKKLILLIVIVVIIAIIGIFSFAPSSYDKQRKPQNILEFCLSLPEEECLANLNCVMRYPIDCETFGGCDPPYCTSTGLNDDDVLQLKSECDKINGTFSRNGFYGFVCLCYSKRYECLKDLREQLATDTFRSPTKTNMSHLIQQSP